MFFPFKVVLGRFYFPFVEFKLSFSFLVFFFLAQSFGLKLFDFIFSFFSAVFDDLIFTIDFHFEFADSLLLVSDSLISLSKLALLFDFDLSLFDVPDFLQAFFLLSQLLVE